MGLTPLLHCCNSLFAEYEPPLLIYIGVIAAFTLIMAIGVLIGKALTKFVPLKYIQLETESSLCLEA